MMRLARAMLAAGLLAGCSTTDYDLGLSPAATEITVTNPRFADRDPTDWKFRAPWTYPVHGTDVSKYQTGVNWAAAKAGGVSFAFIKATEGGDRVDDRFAEHWRGAKAAGVPRGAYHFYYFCRPAAEQAAWFIRHVPREKGALPPVLDMEWNHLSPTCKLRPPPETVQSEMRIFLDLIQRHYGKKPIIYTDPGFYARNGLASFKDYPFWLRSTAAHPSEKYGSHPFVFWQYTGTGTLPGIRGDADINVFNGSEAHWRKWLKANSQ
jgi:lysozyme